MFSHSRVKNDSVEITNVFSVTNCFYQVECIHLRDGVKTFFVSFSDIFLFSFEFIILSFLLVSFLGPKRLSFSYCSNINLHGNGWLMHLKMFERIFTFPEIFLF